MKTFTFSRQTDGTVTATAETKAAFAAHFARNPGTVDRDIVNSAAADLVHKARDLMFATGKSYEDASRHLMSQDPWLRVATAALGEGSRANTALGVVIEETQS